MVTGWPKFGTSCILSDVGDCIRLAIAVCPAYVGKTWPDCPSVQASHFPVLHMCKKCHRIFYVKTCAAGQIECEKTCAAGKTYQTKCAAGRILDEVLIGTLSY